jgi:hypothetical protein
VKAKITLLIANVKTKITLLTCMLQLNALASVTNSSQESKCFGIL